jgi:hypothetical protein
MPRKSDRYEIVNAAASGDWSKITLDALAGLDPKSLRKLLGSIPRSHARSDARDAVLDLIRQEIKHAENQSLGVNG